MRFKISIIVLFLSLSVSGLAGCSKEQILGWFGTSTPDAPPKSAAPKLPVFSSPFMELSVSPSIQAGDCFVRLYTFSDDRPNVLAVTSYRDEESETFPSIMIQAQVTDDDLQALAGRELEASLFATQSANGAVWNHVDGEKVKIKITLGEKDITGEITGGSVISTDADKPTLAKGKFYAKR